MRLEKDKYSNLEINVKRTQMEKELLEKEKNSEINRMKGLLSMPPLPPKDNEIRKL
jgi:hypothetical protein